MIREALLRGVVDRPEEDGPRLIFADWLEEHGNAADLERAKFIRLQIEAHALRKLRHPSRSRKLRDYVTD